MAQHVSCIRPKSSDSVIPLHPVTSPVLSEPIAMSDSQRICSVLQLHATPAKLMEQLRGYVTGTENIEHNEFLAMLGKDINGVRRLKKTINVSVHGNGSQDVYILIVRVGSKEKGDPASAGAGGDPASAGAERFFVITDVIPINLQNWDKSLLDAGFKFERYFPITSVHDQGKQFSVKDGSRALFVLISDPDEVKIFLRLFTPVKGVQTVPPGPLPVTDSEAADMFVTDEPPPEPPPGLADPDTSATFSIPHADLIQQWQGETLTLKDARLKMSEAYKLQDLGDARATLLELRRSDILMKLHQACGDAHGFEHLTQESSKALQDKNAWLDGISSSEEFLLLGAVRNGAPNRESLLKRMNSSRFLYSTRMLREHMGYAISIKGEGILNKDSFLMSRSGDTSVFAIAEGAGSIFSSLATAEAMDFLAKNKDRLTKDGIVPLMNEYLESFITNESRSSWLRSLTIVLGNGNDKTVYRTPGLNETIDTIPLEGRVMILTNGALESFADPEGAYRDYPGKSMVEQGEAVATQILINRLSGVFQSVDSTLIVCE